MESVNNFSRLKSNSTSSDVPLNSNSKQVRCGFCGWITHSTSAHQCVTCSRSGLHKVRNCPQNQGPLRCGFCSARGHTTQEHRCKSCNIKGDHRSRYCNSTYDGKLSRLYQMRNIASTLQILDSSSIPLESGQFGEAVYLYSTPISAYDRNPVESEAVIQAVVEVGRTLMIKQKKDGVVYSNEYLATRGYDSLCVIGFSGHDDALWIVYDVRRVKTLYGVGSNVPEIYWPKGMKN